jgi:parallel beta-helix repeat protein
MRDRQDRNLKRVFVLIFFVFLLSAFVCTASAGETIYVTPPWESIQDAVNRASEGDTIIAGEGVFEENVFVNKRLTIKSKKGPEKTTVQAANSDKEVFYVNADFVNISGFTITIKGSPTHNKAGIILWYCEHCNISNNIISGNWYGIYLHYSSNNAINGNNVSSNTGNGIYLLHSGNNTLANNTVLEQYPNIYLDHSNGNTLTGNNVSNSVRCSVDLYYSNNNTLTNNTASNNGYQGIRLRSSDNNILTDNIALNNSLDGFYLGDSGGNSLKSNCVSSNTRDGIRLDSANNSTLRDNKVRSNSHYGIHLISSKNNTLENNTVILNNYHGIALSFLSDNNSLNYNDVFCNNNSGIYLSSSDNNTLTNNTAFNNSNGIYLFGSYTNKIYLNNLISNTENAYSEDSQNIWNSTEKITYTYLGTTYESYLGNYWGDYEEKYPDAEEIDATGIWDMPYSIEGDKDNYPLMESFENDLQDFVSPSYPLNVSVTVAIDPVAPRNYSQVTVRVTTTEGTPLIDVSVSVSATGGSLSPTSGTTDSKQLPRRVISTVPALIQ